MRCVDGGGENACPVAARAAIMQVEETFIAFVAACGSLSSIDPLSCITVVGAFLGAFKSEKVIELDL